MTLIKVFKLIKKVRISENSLKSVLSKNKSLMIGGHGPVDPLGSATVRDCRGLTGACHILSILYRFH